MIKNVRRNIFLCLLVVFLLFSNIISTNKIIFAKEPMVLASSRAMVVMEGNTNKILFSHNENVKLPMASLTKIITAIVAIENAGNLDEKVKVADESVGIEGTSIYLEKGEELPLKELLIGLMLASGNDCAVAIAYHIGESEENFVKMMNDFVKGIGANNTNLINPHGLDADNHYTTAYDLALITSYALKNKSFLEIVSTKNATISGNSKVEGRYLKHKNKLLFRDENCIGVKTGFTDNAGRCLVHATRQENGLELITVLLNCGPMFEEAQRLNDNAVRKYDYMEFVKPYNFVGTVNINNGSINQTNVATIQGFKTVVKKGEENDYAVEYNIPSSIDAPIKNGDVVGNVVVKYNNEVIFEDVLVSIDSVDNIDLKYMLDNILERWYA